jgi:hypothetical protein
MKRYREHLEAELYAIARAKAKLTGHTIPDASPIEKVFLFYFFFVL